jgi:predicted GH43/DUF377 family glycosyl hydrolase
MFDVKRSAENPILIPDPNSPWESEATFNPTVLVHNGVTHLFYRAVGKPEGGMTEYSRVGHATSKDGTHFNDRTPFIVPEHDWEKRGCEDPRVTFFEGRAFIFYTAVSEFSADGIKVAVAITDDLKTVAEKHLVTPFNAKAMSLFPVRVNGKIAAVLTVNTDRPPTKICLALFERIEDIWSEAYWTRWHADLANHVIDIDMNERDRIEVGAGPLRAKEGWLLFYSYIYNSLSPPAIFGVQALLLDAANPQKIIGEVKRPFLVPEEEYEHYGRVPYVVFPSGAVVRRFIVDIYYGAADTTSCVVSVKLPELIEELLLIAGRQFRRFEGNPVVVPDAGHPWESKATFNPAAIFEAGRVHLLYRAMSDDNTSVLGYASSEDGMHFRERLPEPVYAPREDFERKLVPGGNSGCEDPRLTKLGDMIYMCYTAFDGKNSPRVALTSITASDFLKKNWNWSKPVLISPPGQDDKDAALFPQKIKGKFVFLHRLGADIWIDFVDSLDFSGGKKFLSGEILMRPRDTAWDSKRIGIAGPPTLTEHGWLLLYHGISKRTGHYSVRAALLDLKDPRKILYRTHDSLLDPKMPYEKEGIVPNVTFPCGSVIVNGQLFVYYGGADKVVCVATVDLKALIAGLLHEARFH